MAEHKDTLEPNNSIWDESFIDPRLRSGTTETYRCENQPQASVPISAPSSTLTPILTPPQSEPNDPNGDAPMAYEDTVLPSSAYQSLDSIVGSNKKVHDDGERLWLIGLQAGIGLGIAVTREAVLNEMQFENTVFTRPIQSHPADPDPYHIRMSLGQQCVNGFDLRVANRASQHFISNCKAVVKMVVEQGLTACLPEYGNPLPGTSAFFTEEDSALCHENCRILNQAFGITGPDWKPDLKTGNDSSAGESVPLTASFMADGRSIAGIDMTQLDGSAALIANAVKQEYGIGIDESGTPDPQCIPREHGLAPYVSHLTGEVSYYTEDIQVSGNPEIVGDNWMDEFIDFGHELRNDQAEAEPRATSPNIDCSSSDTTASDEDHIGGPQLRPALVETKSGRAVIVEIRQHWKKN
ncbi:hypothetical protein NUW58_g2821 [Xylaria curta]|uniref:Uncharacterized protein n=2 Tax=Xylaria curta TaxID=42375 RepID=A0ACC1PEP8_9PEZI|nr:hypothetical protein NUW58_g3225 [Xylaria curta]KAJ2990699.1 hypothetical protein NUW58_g2821 [Xylaria curta]